MCVKGLCQVILGILIFFFSVYQSRPEPHGHKLWIKWRLYTTAARQQTQRLHWLQSQVWTLQCGIPEFLPLGRCVCVCVDIHGFPGCVSHAGSYDTLTTLSFSQPDVIHCCGVTAGVGHHEAQIGKDVWIIPSVLTHRRRYVVLFLPFAFLTISEHCWYIWLPHLDQMLK